MTVPAEVGGCARCGAPPDVVVVARAGPILPLCDAHLVEHEAALVKGGFFTVGFSSDIHPIEEQEEE